MSKRARIIAAKAIRALKADSVPDMQDQSRAEAMLTNSLKRKGWDRVQIKRKRGGRRQRGMLDVVASSDVEYHGVPATLSVHGSYYLEYASAQWSIHVQPKGVVGGGVMLGWPNRNPPTLSQASARAMESASVGSWSR